MRQDVTGFFMMLQGDLARGGVGIRAPARGGDLAPGAGWRFEPGCGVGWRFGPQRGVGWEFGPRARGGVGIFGVRWEIFYLFAVFSPFG